jgi:hypothetical protein
MPSQDRWKARAGAARPLTFLHLAFPIKLYMSASLLMLTLF